MPAVRGQLTPDQVIGLLRPTAGACRELGYEPVVLTDCQACEAREAGTFLADVLRDNDAYHALQNITGGTGTNVNDVAVALIRRTPS